MRQHFIWFAVAILLTAGGLRMFQLQAYPPGPHYDEAANLLIARSIAFGGVNLFPIANSYQGRETLYHYISTPLLILVIDDVFALQLTSVFTNFITIAASMALGRVMFRGWRGVVIGLTIGVLMTLSFHQLFMSRQAYRAVTLPMMQALGLLFLWHGLTVKRRGWLWLIVGGVFSGGALYTYMASRLFPAWLLFAGIVLLVVDRAQFRRRLVQGIVFFGALGITALPMLMYAAQNPDIFFQRLGEVTEGEVTVTLAESVRLHLEMFFIRGDFGNLRYNIPGRPYFTPIEGVLLIVGGVVAFWRVFRTQDALERVACFMALISPLMVIPSVISLGGLPPSHMRSLGMVPLIFVLVAIGFEAVFSQALRLLSTARAYPRYGMRRYASALMGILGVALILGSVAVAGAYFRWAQRADLFYQADGDLAAAVSWLEDNGDFADDARVYVAAFHREHPTVISGWDQPVTWLGSDSLFFPSPEQAGLLIFAHNMPPPEDWQAFLQPYWIEDVPQGPDNDPAFWAYHIGHDAETEITALSQLNTQTNAAIRNPYLTFIGLESDQIAAGGQGDVTLFWQVAQSPPYYRLRPILDLQTPGGMTLYSADQFLLGTNTWQPGETMIQRMQVQVPAGTPPGQYPLAITWVDRDSEAYVSFQAEDGSYGGITAELGMVEVIRPETFPLSDAIPIQNRVEMDFAPGVRLIGWELPEAQFRPGEEIAVKTVWQAVPTTTRRQPLTVQASLDDVGRNENAVQKAPNEQNTLFEGQLSYSPENWVDGEIVTQFMLWQIPREYPTGDYTLRLTGDATTRVLNLGQISIRGISRLSYSPNVENTVELYLGDYLILNGYTIRKDNGVYLEVVWSVKSPIAEDYTVFVHVLDANGELITQRDAMPMNNTYPTSLWDGGEYVVDTYGFDELQSDAPYTFRVGMYIQESGLRLPVMRQNGDYIGDYIEFNSINTIP